MNALQSSYQKAELAHEATTVYAQDMPDVSELMSALTPLLREGDGLHWAVLMDTAFDDGVVALPQAEGVLNCFAGAGRLDDLARIAPCLVPLRPGALGEGVLRAMANHAGARPMFSVLASRIELPVLGMVCTTPAVPT